MIKKLLCIIFLFGGLAHADTLTWTVTTSPSVGEDTWLNSNAATTNYGGAGAFIVGDSGYSIGSEDYVPGYAIMHFGSIEESLSAKGATDIVACTLFIDPRTVIGSPTSADSLYVHGIRRSDWSELQATWNIYKTSNNWGTAGARSTTTDIYALVVAKKCMTDTTSPTNGICAIDMVVWGDSILTGSYNGNYGVKLTRQDAMFGSGTRKAISYASTEGLGEEPVLKFVYIVPAASTSPSGKLHSPQGNFLLHGPTGVGSLHRP